MPMSYLQTKHRKGHRNQGPKQDRAAKPALTSPYPPSGFLAPMPEVIRHEVDGMTGGHSSNLDAG